MQHVQEVRSPSSLPLLTSSAWVYLTSSKLRARQLHPQLQQGRRRCRQKRIDAVTRSNGRDRSRGRLVICPQENAVSSVWLYIF